MAQYFRANNPGGTVQIDDTYRNLAFVQRFIAPVTADPRAGYANGGKFTFTITGVNPVVAFEGVHNAVLVSRTQNGNQFTFSGLVTQVANFGVVVFDYPSLSGNGQYLAIKNAAGELLFDGAQKYMRVAAMCNVVLGAQQQSYSQSLPAGRTYVALVGLCGNVGQVVGGPVAGGPSWRTQTISMRAAVNIVPGGYEARLLALYNVYNEGERPPVFPSISGWGRGLAFAPIIDVTNFY